MQRSDGLGGGFAGLQVAHVHLDVPALHAAVAVGEVGGDLEAAQLLSCREGLRAVHREDGAEAQRRCLAARAENAREADQAEGEGWKWAPDEWQHGLLISPGSGQDDVGLPEAVGSNTRSTPAASGPRVAPWVGATLRCRGPSSSVGCPTAGRPTART